MTTPERLRRRQRRESAALAALALALVAAWFYFDARDDAQQRCLSTFIERDSQTGAIRSKIVEDESKAERRVILRALSANDRGDIAQARARYKAALTKIDEAREANPVTPFPEGVCD